MSMRICNAEKSGFLDARAVSGIVNAHIQYRRIANRLSGIAEKVRELMKGGIAS